MKNKDRVSKYKWYTLSGIFSRIASLLATKWADSPNELFPVFVFAYGMSELFGVRRSVKILVRFHDKHAKKLRQKSGVRHNNNANSTADSIRTPS